MSRSVMIPMPEVSGLCTTALPTPRRVIRCAAWRRVWRGPIMRISVDMASWTWRGVGLGRHGSSLMFRRG